MLFYPLTRQLGCNTFEAGKIFICGLRETSLIRKSVIIIAIEGTAGRLSIFLLAAKFAGTVCSTSKPSAEKNTKRNAWVLWSLKKGNHMPIMDILVLLIFPVCGILACGLFLGDMAEEFEKYHKQDGPIVFKDARLSFKTFLCSALVTRMIFGVFVFPSAVVYKLLMKEDFYFRFSLPKDFWTKYFKE